MPPRPEPSRSIKRELNNPLIQKHIVKKEANHNDGEAFDEVNYVKQLRKTRQEKRRMDRHVAMQIANDLPMRNQKQMPGSTRNWFRSKTLKKLDVQFAGGFNITYSNSAVELLRNASRTFMHQLLQKQLNNAIADRSDTILPRHALAAVYNMPDAAAYVDEYAKFSKEPDVTLDERLRGELIYEDYKPRTQLSEEEKLYRAKLQELDEDEDQDQEEQQQEDPNDESYLVAVKKEQNIDDSSSSENEEEEE